MQGNAELLSISSNDSIWNSDNEGERFLFQFRVENYIFEVIFFGMITYIIFLFFSGDDEDSANQKRKRILQSQRPVDSDELFSKYALCYKLENSQIFSKKSLVS